MSGDSSDTAAYPALALADAVDAIHQDQSRPQSQPQPQAQATRQQQTRQPEPHSDLSPAHQDNISEPVQHSLDQRPQQQQRGEEEAAAEEAEEELQHRRGGEGELQHQHQHQPPQETTDDQLIADAPAAHHDHRDHHGQHQIPVSVPYNGLQATAVAHHGLQALEAATASATTPLVQQYAQSASMHVADTIQYAPMTPHPPVVANGLSMSPTPLPQSNQKVTRLRRACDMCSSRKVKCDESGPPCKPCRDLNVECTFSREMKRRGPPNKHAEAAKAAKRARVEALSPAHNTSDAMTGPIGSQVNVLDAEIIAPWPVLTLLVDDFFTYIHPLMPFPHEPTFRAAFDSRADRTSSEFLALLASMIGVLVASFPRSARSHLKATHSTSLFPTAITMIDRCRAVAMDSRGSTYMAKEEMTVDDATTSYFLALSAAYTLQWKTCKRYMAETMTFCRELLAQRRSDTASHAADMAAALTGPSRPIDHIQDQVSKRIFWVMVAGLRSMTQLGASINEIPLPPPTTQEPYPDLPVEVDDDLIYSHQILAQPDGTTSLITGFNHNVNTYMAMNELVGVDMCYGINFFEWSAQKSMLSNALSSTKAHLERLPDSLQIRVDPAQLENGLGAVADDPSLRYYPPAFPATQPPNDVRHTLAEDPHRRRRLQLEIQKANIYASQLATRSYFVERYLNLRDNHRAHTALSSQAGDAKGRAQDMRDEMDNMVYDEREAIIKSLLTVLTSITQRNMEPNGVSLVNKIRQIASTLLNDAPERKGPVAKQAEEYLGKFLEILVKLERTGARTASGTMTPQDEDEELQHWASLRDYQIQFVNSGGYLGGAY